MAVAYILSVPIYDAVVRVSTESETKGKRKVLPAAAPTLVYNSITNSTPLIECSTTKGEISIELHHKRCPRSARQIVMLVASGSLNQGVAFWRVNK